MDHWTEAADPTAEPGIEAAERFTEHFVVEDGAGSILCDDLYTTYTRWTTERGHEPLPELEFLEVVTDQVSFDTTAVTQNLEWIQRFDGLGLSFVDAF